MTVQKLEELLAENAIGAEEFSMCLGMSEKQALDLLSGKKKLTASLARQIEQTFSKPKHWLESDEDGQEAVYDLFG